MKFWWKWCWNK